MGGGPGRRGLPADGFTAVALAYIGLELTAPIYWQGTIGAAVWAPVERRVLGGGDGVVRRRAAVESMAPTAWEARGDAHCAEGPGAGLDGPSGRVQWRFIGELVSPEG
ncbi:hypothetical protein ACFVX6_37430 [Streptomyces sp. NPDC058289]|uniref:hypothetical protein n=1 Tax=Streptomyces sp. NPDC058289 TaxID=3346425 RepID=UPI0036E5D9BC